jgi:periplasmic protein TonB
MPPESRWLPVVWPLRTDVDRFQPGPVVPVLACRGFGVWPDKCTGSARKVKNMFSSPKRSALLSGLLHGAAILLVVWFTRVTAPPPPAMQPVFLINPDIGRFIPHFQRPPKEGGGGGGDRDRTPASRGRLARAALRQFTPPIAVIRNSEARMTLEPTLVGLPDVEMPALPFENYGDPNGVLGKLSNGRGSGGGIGDGMGGGVGDSRGPGYGPGEGGGTSGTNSAGGPITPPVLLWKGEPEYSEEARKARVQGMVVLLIEIDARGRAQNIRVRQGLGLGLDERAMQAVGGWRFRPGTRSGKPIVTTAEVYINFRLL